jgi:predicted nucleotide-binding protein (sugar kinase/HSP70/actin superfamily)
MVKGSMTVYELKYFRKSTINTNEGIKGRKISITNQKKKCKYKIGIPRALLYYKFYPLWETFFEELGGDVVVSPLTNKKIKNAAISTAPDEDCYSTKLYYGHVMYLKDKVDYLFIPRFQSEHSTNVSCPKFLGLAESLRSMFPDLPPILMPVFSKAKMGHNKWRIVKIAFSIGKMFTKNPFKIIRATRIAFRTQKHWKLDKWLTLKELKDWKHDKIYVNTPPEIKGDLKPLKIALVGHCYMINDPYASLNIKQQLIDVGANLITSEQLPREIIKEQMAKLDFNMYFDYERELLSTVMHFLEDKSVDGIIHIIIFSCGPDSIIGEMVSQFSKRNPAIPVLQLTFDELTGEAGLKTRLEAFIDMVTRKKKMESRI